MSAVIDPLSQVIGLPESTLRLLLTILFAYPAAYLYKKRYHSQDSPKSTREDRNQYILLSGLALNLFFNGSQIYHSLITIAASYSFCFFLGEQMQNRKLAVAGVWIFNAVYLLAGYYFMETDEYDITWTMTQCILCLRMMGFGFDYYDGRKKFTVPNPPSKDQLEKNQDPTKAAIRSTETAKSPAVLPLSFGADTPLTELPSIQFVTAYALYPAAFVVGPQFSFSLYSKWLDRVDLKLTAEQQGERERAQGAHVLHSVLLAIVYLGFQQAFGSKYSTSYLLTDEYLSFNFFKRAFFFCIAGKFTYSKYIGIWLLTEGAIAAFDISYEGINEEGLAQYGGLANTLPEKFETATSLHEVIGSFNINTNLWSKYYVFKRLKFLGNKLASQFGTLAFLAIWHGFHSVYFSTFALEFLFVLCEAILTKRLVPLIQSYAKQNEIYFYLWRCIAWIACQAAIAYGIVGFELLKFSRAWIAYKSVGFIGHFAILIIVVADKYLPSYLDTSKLKKKQI